MKKILISLSIVSVVAVVAIGTTIALFSDTETSTGNIFVAGNLDLKVDHRYSMYNGEECISICVPGATNLLQTIGFETPEVTNDAKWEIFPSPVGGWTVEWYGGFTPYGGYDRPEPANLEYHEGVLGDAYEGDQYVELDTDWYGPGHSQSGEPASARIYQDVSTVAGKEYQVKFAFAPRPNTPASDNAVDVLWEGAVVYSIGPIAGGGGPIAWTLHSFDVTASDNLSRLEFIDKGTPNSLGTFIDHLQLYEYTCEYETIGGTCTLWEEKDLEEGDYYWNFDDVKPGDYGINIISLHAYDNDAYACIITHDIVDAEDTVDDPEIDAGDTIESIIGELSGFINVFAWEDTNQNNAYDDGEPIIAPANTPITTAIGAIPLTACNTKYIGVAWCFGAQSVVGSDIQCDGSGDQDIAQTDTMTASITAYIEQQRNNSGFDCTNVNLGP